VNQIRQMTRRVVSLEKRQGCQVDAKNR